MESKHIQGLRHWRGTLIPMLPIHPWSTIIINLLQCGLFFFFFWVWTIFDNYFLSFNILTVLLKSHIYKISWLWNYQVSNGLLLNQYFWLNVIKLSVNIWARKLVEMIDCVIRCWEFWCENCTISWLCRD